MYLVVPAGWAKYHQKPRRVGCPQLPVRRPCVGTCVVSCCTFVGTCVCTYVGTYVGTYVVSCSTSVWANAGALNTMRKTWRGIGNTRLRAGTVAKPFRLPACTASLAVAIVGIPPLPRCTTQVGSGVRRAAFDTTPARSRRVCRACIPNIRPGVVQALLAKSDITHERY